MLESSTPLALMVALLAAPPAVNPQRERAGRSEWFGRAGLGHLSFAYGDGGPNDLASGLAVGIELGRAWTLSSVVSLLASLNVAHAPSPGYAEDWGTASPGDDFEPITAGLLGPGIGFLYAPLEASLILGAAYIGSPYSSRQVYPGETISGWGIGYSISLACTWQVGRGGYRIGPFVGRLGTAVAEDHFWIPPDDDHPHGGIGLWLVGVQGSYDPRAADREPSRPPASDAQREPQPERQRAPLGRR